MKLAVVMPGPLNPRPVDQSVFAEQLASFIPLPAEPVKQSGLVWFLACENSILVPGAHGAVSATLSQGHLLAELTVSIILALNGAAHDGFLVGPGRCDAKVVVRTLLYAIQRIGYGNDF